VPQQPTDKSIERVKKLVTSFCANSGTTTHPDPEITQSVVLGLAKNLDDLGRPLCPCRFYPNKKEEVKHRTWICPCDDMNVYKYCHCLLFTDAKGLPVTEHLPQDHDGRKTWGEVTDPTPDKGRVLRGKAEEREKERRERPS
jgi:ferredoxin-thioredoxin reductase catalytic chain